MKTLTKVCFFLSMIFLSDFAFGQKPDADILLKEALYETNVNKDYNKALSIAETALKLAPEYTDVIFLLGRLHMLQGDGEKAKVYLKRVLEKDSKNLDALNYLINIEASEKKYAEAIGYVEKALSLQYSEELLLKKAGFQNLMSNHRPALLTLKPIFSNPKARDLYLSILQAQSKSHLLNQDTTAAVTTLNELIYLDAKNEYALNELLSISLERKDYERSLEMVDKQLDIHPSSEKLVLTKISILENLGNKQGAYDLANKLSSSDTVSVSAKVMRDNLFYETRKNRIGLYHDYTFFSPNRNDPWNVTSVSYMREGEFASIGARVNFADRGISGQGWQIELESYPKHKEGYSYVNVAYSNAVIYPKFKLSYSYYTFLSKEWESEIGVRYFKTATDNFVGAGGGIGKYMGSYFLNLRPYAFYINNKIYSSASINLRKYFESKESYFTVGIGMGVSPDERIRDVQFNFSNNLNSYSVTTGFQQLLFKSSHLGLFGTYNRQEIAASRYRNEYSVNISLLHKF